MKFRLYRIPARHIFDAVKNDVYKIVTSQTIFVFSHVWHLETSNRLAAWFCRLCIMTSTLFPSTSRSAVSDDVAQSSENRLKQGVSTFEAEHRDMGFNCFLLSCSTASFWFVVISPTAEVFQPGSRLGLRFRDTRLVTNCAADSTPFVTTS